MDVLHTLPAAYTVSSQDSYSLLQHKQEALDRGEEHCGWRLDKPLPQPAFYEVTELSRHLRPQAAQVGISLEGARVKDINLYIAVMQQLQLVNKNTFFYVVTDKRQILEYLVEIFRWFHPAPEIYRNDFFIYPNTFYPLTPWQRDVADITMLSKMEQILCTPYNLKASLAKELTGVKAISDFSESMYCFDLRAEKVL
tara:strand:- start:285 stop:875 length:591 start_codon:yes stop_codon:yes gene_type:complete